MKKEKIIQIIPAPKNLVVKYKYIKDLKSVLCIGLTDAGRVVLLDSSNTTYLQKLDSEKVEKIGIETWF